MIAPTPLLKPSPMDVSALFSGTWTLFKKKLGLYILIMVGAFAVNAVVTGLFVLLVVGLIGGLAAVATPSGGAVAGIALGYVVLLVVSVLVLYKSQAMVIYAAYEVAQGKTPTFSSALSGTKGFLPRILVLLVLGFLLMLVLGGLFALLLGGTFSAAYANGDPSGIFAGIGLTMLVMFISVPVVYYFAVKLIYVLPVVAIEQADGISALKRSWKLTNGAFWRTLGYLLLVTIIVGVASTVISFISQIFMIPWTQSMQSLENTNDPAAVLAVMMTAIPFLIIPMLLGVVFNIAALPFVFSYITVMYIDQVRRSEMPAGYGVTPSQPGYPQQQSYPAPPPNPPQPGTGYPPPPPAQPQ